MRRAFAAILAVWSTLALVAVLAWSQPTSTSSASSARGVPMTVVVQGKNGSRRLARVLVLPSGTAAVVATHSSTTTGAAPATTSAAGVVLPASSVQPVVSTRTS